MPKKKDRQLRYYQLPEKKGAPYKGRPKIQFGLCTEEEAKTLRKHIREVMNKRAKGLELATATALWLQTIDGDFRARLESLGILEATQKATRWTVSAFIESYIKSRKDIKSGTKRRLEDVKKKMDAFFQGDHIEDVTAQQAKNFRIHLKTTHGLAENTVRRHIGICRQFFNAAIDAELITKNPFRGQPVCVQANESRFFYVTPEIAQQALDACPDAEWRLIFGLARFGGLRCPSEVLRLKWTDIDFENSQFTVHATKTEHHADGGVRVVPMFQELKPLFQDAYDAAREGAVYCIERQKGDKEVNLRTQFERILKRAGVKTWPKLFQNCRSTRETELFKITQGNIKAVCEWIGNTPAVAMAHYAQVTEADRKEAAKKTVLGEAENAVQKVVQKASENDCNPVQDQKDGANTTPDNCTAYGSSAPGYNDLQKDKKWAIQDSNL